VTVEGYVKHAEAILADNPWQSWDSLRRLVVAQAQRDPGVDARRVDEALDRLRERRREEAAT
jgi:hypothetical protein